MDFRDAWYWPITLAFIAFVVVVIIAKRLIVWRATRRWRFEGEEPWCGQCTYSLHGLEDATVCPECGAETEHIRPVTNPSLYVAYMHDRLDHWSLCVYALAAVALVFLTPATSLRTESYGFWMTPAADGPGTANDLRFNLTIHHDDWGIGSWRFKRLSSQEWVWSGDITDSPMTEVVWIDLNPDNGMWRHSSSTNSKMTLHHQWPDEDAILKVISDAGLSKVDAHARLQAKTIADFLAYRSGRSDTKPQFAEHWNSWHTSSAQPPAKKPVTLPAMVAGLLIIWLVGALAIRRRFLTHGVRHRKPVSIGKRPLTG